MLSVLIVNKTDSVLIQLFRYTVVGGMAFILDFSTLYLLTEYLLIHYLVSAVIAFLLGLTFNYVLSTLWVFSSRNLENRYAEFVIFSCIGFGGLLTNELTIYFFTEFASLHYLHSKLISTAIVYIFNFSLRKYILFK